MNVYRAADDTWFVLLVTPDRLEAVAKAIGRSDLLTDPRFAEPAKLMANMPLLPPQAPPKANSFSAMIGSIPWKMGCGRAFAAS